MAIGIPTAIVLGPNFAGAAAPSKPKESEKKGYWFYKEPPPAEEPPVEPDPTQKQYADLPPPPPESELMNMHPKQVEKLIDDYRQYALWKTTPQNVAWYYELQDHARRRSRAFMNVSQMVMLQNPQLNMKTTNPTNVPGIEAKTTQRRNDLNERLAIERENAALVLLTRHECGMCAAQKGVLRYFQQKHGWEVREIDIGDRPDVAARFATDYTPTTVVIFRGSDDWMPVAVGVEALPQVEESTYRAIRLLRGETTPQQFTMQGIHKGSVLDPVREVQP